MDQQSSVDIPHPPVGREPTLKSQLARVPVKAWIVLGLFLSAAILMAAHTALYLQDASLHLKLQHGFRSARLSVFIDDGLAYSAHLSGSTKKRFGLIPDSVQGSLSQAIPVSSGKHAIRLRVEPDDGVPVEESTSAEFASHSERDLSASARRGGVSLTWQGINAAESSSSGASGWFSRYAGSLAMTIAGSIISALTGYAIRELPGQLRSRGAEPKI
jgi:hypothetical protein